jgi:hypothetical protein
MEEAAETQAVEVSRAMGVDCTVARSSLCGQCVFSPVHCRREPCAIGDVRSSAHCAPKLDTHTRRLPLGFAQGKRKCASCLWFPEVRASTTHGPHVRSPPPFSSAAALSCSCGYPAYPTIRRKRADQSGCCLAALCELHLAVCGCFWSLIEI